MKKFLIILLSLTLALCVFSACGKKKTDTVTVTITGGTIVSTGAATGTFDKGTEITIKYTEVNGQEFEYWMEEGKEDDIVDDNEEYTFTVEKDIHLIAKTKAVDKSFENVVFASEMKVGYNGGNAVPEITCDDPGTFVTKTYVVKNAAGEEIGSTAVECGVYTVTATLSADNYHTVSKTMTLTIVEGTLPTFVNDTVVTYNPTGTPQVEVVNALNGTVKIEYKDAAGTVVEQPRDVGVYNATVTVTAPNYKTAILNATLTIEKAQGVISVPDSVRVEVATIGEGITTVAGAALNNDEQQLTFKFVKDNQEVSPVTELGDYTVFVSAAETANYKAAMQKQVRLVVYKQEEVSEDDAQNLQNLSFTDVTVPYNGQDQSVVLTGEYPTSLYTIAYDSNVGKNAGTYSATAYITNRSTGTVVTKTAKLTITPIDLTITAPQYTLIQGEQLPNIAADVSFSGLAEGETVANLNGKLTLTYDFTRTSAIGEYVIDIGGCTSKNYNITYVPGKADIAMATFTLTEESRISPKLLPASGTLDGATLGLQYDSTVTSQTTLYGEEFYGLGVNYFSLLVSAVNPKTNYDSSIALGNLDLLASYNVKAIRFSMMPFYSRDYGVFTNYYGAYIRALDEIVNKCEEVGIGLVPSFWWTAAVQDLYDEPTKLALLDPNSKTYKFMMEYTTFIVNRYKDSPALFMWEYGNELNLACEIGVNPDSLPSGSSRPQRTNDEDMFTAAAMNKFYTDWVATITAADPHHRCISNGDAVYRGGQYNQWVGNKDRTADWSLTKNTQLIGTPDGADTKEQQFAIASILNPGNMNAISWHVYAGSKGLVEGSSNYVGPFSAKIKITTWEEYMNHMMEMGRSMNKTCYIGECGPSSGGGTVGKPGDEYTYVDQKRCIDAIGDAMIKTHYPLALLWNYDQSGLLTADRSDEHSLGTEWSWCVQSDNDKGFFFLTSLKETNDAIDAGLDAATRVAEPVRGEDFITSPSDRD